MFGFNRPYVKNKGQIFCPIYLPGENYSFYCNLDKLTDGIDRATELQLVDINGNFVFRFGIVKILVVSGGTVGYHFYFNSFVFPYINDGYYHFRLFQSFLGYEICRSNIIQCSSSCVLTTSYLKFRHNDQLFGVRYDLLPNFYQKFRVPLNQIKAPEIRSERVQYRQSSNGRELRVSKSFRDIVMTLEMYWSNDEDIAAISAVNEHSEVYVNFNRLIQLTQIKTEKPDEKSNQSKSTLECIVDDYNLNYNDLEHYGGAGDWLWGGNNHYNVVNFVSP